VGGDFEDIIEVREGQYGRFISESKVHQLDKVVSTSKQALPDLFKLLKTTP